MNQGTGRMGLTGVRVVIARLLAVILLLASLLVPPFAEAASSGVPFTTAAVSAAADQDGGAPDTSTRPHGILHSGAHCACHLADRLTPPVPVSPIKQCAVAHPAFATHTHASLEAEPPARPPRA